MHNTQSRLKLLYRKMIPHYTTRKYFLKSEVKPGIVCPYSTFLVAPFVVSGFSSFLPLLKDFWDSSTGIYASLVFLKTSLSDSRGLTSFFSTFSNLAVAHGAVPTFFAELGESIVRVDASSRDAYHE